ncbi:hypothetical protein Tco_0554615 [Tanacetum coccineum]
MSSKGKGKMVEPDKPMKKKDLIMLDEEIASKLQAEFDDEAKIEVDHELAQRLLSGRKFKESRRRVRIRETKKHRKIQVDDDKETVELKSLMEVMPDEEEVALDAIPLAVKSPSILDWKIHKEGKKSYYQIIRAIKFQKMYSSDIKDKVQKNQSDYRVLDWKLYGSCGVHSLRKQNVHNHMLVEKRYPLTAPTITDLLTRSFRLTIAVKWHISFLNFLQNSSRINEVFGSILLVIMKILIRNLEIFGDKYQV